MAIPEAVRIRGCCPINYSPTEPLQLSSDCRGLKRERLLYSEEKTQLVWVAGCAPSPSLPHPLTLTLMPAYRSVLVDGVWTYVVVEDSSCVCLVCDGSGVMVKWEGKRQEERLKCCACGGEGRVPFRNAY